MKTKQKEIIEKLQAKLTLQLGIHFTQQEVVDLCIEFAYSKPDEFLRFVSNIPKLTPQLAKAIIDRIDQLPQVPYDLSLIDARNNDKDIYSL